MFASKDMFGDDEGGGSHQQYGRHPTGPASPSRNAFPQSSSSSAASALTSSTDLPSTPTPAMRKAKLDELKRAQLDKRKSRILVGGAVAVRNEDQIKSGPNAGTQPHAMHAAPASVTAASPRPFMSSPSSQGGHGNGPMSYRQSNAYAGGAAASSPVSSRGSETASSSTYDYSDDDEDGGPAAIGVDPSMSSLLAQKRAAKAAAHQGPQGGMSVAEREMLSQGIAPVFDPVRPLNSAGGGGGSHASASSVGGAANGVNPMAAAAASRLDYSDMRRFLMEPIPKGVLFQCYILRNKKGIKNKIYPSYELYVSGEERFLMAARKRSKNKTSNYYITLDKSQLDGMHKDATGYLGKVRSNFVGTEFICYDRGINPEELGADALALAAASGATINPQSPALTNVRQELGAVFYESNILGSKGPRKMTAVIPAPKRDGSRTILKPLCAEDSLTARFKSQPSSSDFFIMVNKTPKWNEQVGAYVLNFNGRVTQASVKNFQAVHLDDPENVLLQFGRIGKDTFTMDIQYPLSPLQAFSICLTSFDYKFACE